MMCLPEHKQERECGMMDGYFLREKSHFLKAHSIRNVTTTFQKRRSGLQKSLGRFLKTS
jgi:hypothetical protein